jgi:arsenate reductase-like glutaredoxin family protein
LLAKKADMVERDLGREPLSEAELERLFRGRDPRDFLNTRNEMYRRLNMKEKPPGERETLRLMAKEPNLIRRPLTFRGSKVVAGYDEAALLGLLSGARRRTSAPTR